MNVTLTWQGPVGPGRFPDDPLVFETLCQPGVYLRVKCYDDERLIAYVGQSVSLLARFDQHLTSMMSLGAPLRDSSGTVVFFGDAASRMEAYKTLSEIAALAAADTDRVRFWYALCDDA
ncbi:MAG: GIY-YIG nuclease family protein, partial [Proteobacteria bacterium]|nr:GIY-YIG nuclease family protein [Pseudomonadota bacterium]